MWLNNEVVLPCDPCGQCEIVDGLPDCDKLSEPDGKYRASAPDYAPEEILKVTSKLSKRAADYHRHHRHHRMSRA